MPPNENDPTAAPPVPPKRQHRGPPPSKLLQAQAARSEAIASNTDQQTDIPGEPLDLPSRGLLYGQDLPNLVGGTIMVRPILTTEEDIFATERFWKQGIAIDMLLARCIVTRGVNTLKLLSGDRTHILFYLRAISYGPDYSFKYRMSDGSMQEIKTNIGKLEVQTLPDDFVEPFLIQMDGTSYEFRFSRGEDEQNAIQETMIRKRKNPNAPDADIPGALIRLLISVNGSQDRDVIAKHIRSMKAGTAHKLRALVAAKSPGPKVAIDVINNQTGESEDVRVALTESFFRPSE